VSTTSKYLSVIDLGVVLQACAKVHADAKLLPPPAPLPPTPHPGCAPSSLLPNPLPSPTQSPPAPPPLFSLALHPVPPSPALPPSRRGGRKIFLLTRAHIYMPSSPKDSGLWWTNKTCTNKRFPKIQICSLLINSFAQPDGMNFKK
jgi:hypothetical protein